jgi:hypothetical protein
VYILIKRIVSINSRCNRMEPVYTNFSSNYIPIRFVLGESCNCILDPRNKLMEINSNSPLLNLCKFRRTILRG